VLFQSLLLDSFPFKGHCTYCITSLPIDKQTWLPSSSSQPCWQSKVELREQWMTTHIGFTTLKCPHGMLRDGWIINLLLARWTFLTGCQIWIGRGDYPCRLMGWGSKVLLLWLGHSGKHSGNKQQPSKEFSLPCRKGKRLLANVKSVACIRRAYHKTSHNKDQRKLICFGKERPLEDLAR
jgi:hypothetical protein